MDHSISIFFFKCRYNSSPLTWIFFKVILYWVDSNRWFFTFYSILLILKVPVCSQIWVSLWQLFSNSWDCKNTIYAPTTYWNPLWQSNLSTGYLCFLSWFGRHSYKYLTDVCFSTDKKETLPETSVLNIQGKILKTHCSFPSHVRWSAHQVS